MNSPSRSIQPARSEGHLAPSRIASYFDGALSNHQLDQVEQHLGTCSDCRARLAVMTGARQAVRYLPLPPVPEKVWKQIAGRLERSEDRKQPRDGQAKGSGRSTGQPARDNRERRHDGPPTGADAPRNRDRRAKHRDDAPSAEDPRPPRKAHSKRNPVRGRDEPNSGCPPSEQDNSAPTRTDGRPMDRSRPADAPFGDESRSTSWRWPAAVVILFALGAVLIASPIDSDLLASVGPAEEGFDYGEFIAGHHSSDDLARFTQKYSRQRLALTDRGVLTERLVGSDLLGSSPGGLRARAAYTLSDDGIRATQVTYFRHGTTVDVFRQPADHPARFDGYRTEAVTIAGAKCLKISESGIQAATFTAGKARFVVVGPQGDRAFSSVIADLRRAVQG